jgi:hypothetical protein
MMAVGWRPGEAVQELRVGAVEADLGIEFPADYRAFLLETGAARWRGLWGVDEIVSLNRTMPVFRAFRGIVGIGSEGFFVVAFDFRGPGLPPLISVGLSSSDPDDIQKEADSFLEWLETTLPKR